MCRFYYYLFYQWSHWFWEIHIYCRRGDYFPRHFCFPSSPNITSISIKKYISFRCERNALYQYVCDKYERPLAGFRMSMLSQRFCAKMKDIKFQTVKSSEENKIVWRRVKSLFTHIGYMIGIPVSNIFIYHEFTHYKRQRNAESSYCEFI